MLSPELQVCSPGYKLSAGHFFGICFGGLTAGEEFSPVFWGPNPLISTRATPSCRGLEQTPGVHRSNFFPRYLRRGRSTCPWTAAGKSSVPPRNCWRTATSPGNPPSSGALAAAGGSGAGRPTSWARGAAALLPRLSARRPRPGWIRGAGSARLPPSPGSLSPPRLRPPRSHAL